MNTKMDMAREISRRISACMPIVRSLQLFWTKAECSKSWKIDVYNVVILSKLAYVWFRISLPNRGLREKTKRVPSKRIAKYSRHTTQQTDEKCKLKSKPYKSTRRINWIVDVIGNII